MIKHEEVVKALVNIRGNTTIKTTSHFIGNFLDTDLIEFDRDNFKKDYQIIETYITELEDLKKRDTAMKPKMINHLGAGLYSFICGNCGGYFTLDSSQHNYCIFCGTRIDWSDKDE